jgi:hypothetical protein
MSRGSKRKHDSCLDRFRPILGECIFSERHSTKVLTDSLQRQITALKATLASMSADAPNAQGKAEDVAGSPPLETIPQGHPLSEFGAACLVSKPWSRIPCGQIRKIYLQFHAASNADGRKPINHIHFSRLLRAIWVTEGCAARKMYMGLEVNPQWIINSSLASGADDKQGMSQSAESREKCPVDPGCRVPFRKC